MRVLRLAITIALFLVAFSLIAGERLARAAPRHNLCADAQGAVRFGVSSYGSLRDWAIEANEQQADFRFLYVYILAGGMDDPDNFEEWYVRPFAQTAVDIGAIPVFTFYQLLDLGEAAGFSGAHEADIVAQTLTDADLMRTYFDHFVWLLEIASSFPPPVIVHVEPDSWGFMMWAMGVEGNADPSSIPVRVDASGHPDVAGFSDDAAGLGKALVALRDQHAPDVRLGWHASNFRVGTRPDVVVDFFGAMGDWDLLVGEHPHLEADPSTWWEAWDPDALDTNLEWMQTVTSGTGLPLLLWQVPIGTMDWHLLGEPGAAENLGRMAQAGVIGALFEHIAHQGESDPDDIRASGTLGTPPPASSPAGGTAADMRDRVVAYAQQPLAFPEGSVCYESSAGAGGSSGTGGSNMGGASGGGASAGASGGGASGASGTSSSASNGDDDSGCSCSQPATHSGHSWAWMSLVMLGLAMRLRGRFGA